MTAPPPAASLPEVTVAIVNYNGEQTLAPTLRSVFALRGVTLARVIVADNASTDGSVALVEREFPQAVCQCLPDNRGPNPARNAGLRLAATGRVLIMDNDILLAPDYVRRLWEALEQNPEAGAAAGQIRLADSGEQVQYNGADIHYAGEIRLRPFAATGTARVGCVSAGATLFDRERALAAGGFDEDLFFGWEDGDLAFRLSLLGFPCYAVSEAVAYHLKGARGTRWIRLQTRNRWWFIFKHYERRTLWLALPAILLFQGLAGLFCLLKGRFPDFVRGTLEGWRGRAVWAPKRAEIQPRRVVRDRDLLCGNRLHVPGNALVRAVGAGVSLICQAYWLAIRPLLRR